MSQARLCDIFKATDQKWYMLLGDREYAYDQDECTLYGPFNSEEAVHKELNNHSNPGGMSVDNTGTRPVPSPSAYRRKAPTTQLWWRL
jgi:hypothetical protein